MSTIEDYGLVRIDDRLIHGQVIAVWCRHQKFDRIVIVDDGVAADPYLQQVLALAAPPGLQVHVLAVAEAAHLLNQEGFDHRTTMIIMRSTSAARRLYDGGLKYPALNIGGIGGGPGRKNIFKNISVSAEDIETLKYLSGQGIKITLLTVPGEQMRQFSDLVTKL